MARKTKKNLITHRKLSSMVLGLAGLLCVAGLAILFFTFAPLLHEEIKYAVGATKIITPIDQDFGIVIPKLGANAHVIANVDPYDSRAYQYALTKGVAHARGTSAPGAQGNIFLFAHSSEDFYQALQYNSVFYLLNKLDKEDNIDLYYKGVKFTYTVTGKKFVEAKNISYLTGKGEGQTLTLMTCWPPGTNSKRLLVFAKRTE